MRILLTGASSFTGFWFVRELFEQGHEVICPFRGTYESYCDLRKKRIDAILDKIEPWYGCAFGDDAFFGKLNQLKTIDVLCHHAADVTDYKSLDFDVSRAVTNNTYQLKRVLEVLKDKGASRVVLTGSVFESGEGAGSQGLPAFSPYGLSKGLTSQIVQYYTQVCGLQLGKFVIPNPFGPYEEPRFTSYLIRSWASAKTPGCNTPLYVRDNIHVALLAKAYVDFVCSASQHLEFEKLNPSGYIESQGDFARRFAREMEARLGMACPVELAGQTEFSEPRIRINTDPIDCTRYGLDEAQLWDTLAQYYQS